MTTVTVAQGTRSQLLYKKQSALGTPATGNFTIARINSHSLNAMIDQIEPSEIRSDREIYDMRQGNLSARGSTTHDFCYGAHDVFLESAMFSTFSAGVTDNDGIMSIGTSPQYLSMEDGALDVGIYRPFYDMLASRASFRMGTGREAIVRLSIDWVGLAGGDAAAASIGGTPVAPTALRRPFDTFSGALWDNEPETGTEMIEVTSLDINIDNGANPIFGFGQQSGIAIEYGRGRVSGQATMYYSARAKQTLERYIRDIEGVLVANITDTQNDTYEFRMSRVKFTGGDVPLANERSRIVTVPFQALKPSGTSSLVITKTLA